MRGVSGHTHQGGGGAKDIAAGNGVVVWCRPLGETEDCSSQRSNA